MVIVEGALRRGYLRLYTQELKGNADSICEANMINSTVSKKKEYSRTDDSILFVLPRTYPCRTAAALLEVSLERQHSPGFTVFYQSFHTPISSNNNAMMHKSIEEAPVRRNV